jgi:tetratricopeptide (TPR) repeat protein
VSRDSIAFGITGVFFGLLVGWIIGSQQGRTAPAPADAPAASAQPSAQTPRQRTAAPLDEGRATTLARQAGENPRDAAVRIELGNVYFDAERFEDAVKWYEQALEIDPKNVNASTDLGIGYYYLNQPDRALSQFERSLAIDPLHTKTLLNIGIVRAYGKDDLDGAARAWQRVVEIAPDTPEGRVAQQALQAVKGAHPNVPGGPSQKPPG